MIEFPSLAERVSALEAQQKDTKEDLNEIKTKLDQLLDLKSKGFGAVWLVGILLIFGSGLASFFTNIYNLLPRFH